MKYTNKRFKIEAMQVTLDNAREVADWCGGTSSDIFEIEGEKDVEVILPNMTNVLLGDYVVKTEDDFECMFQEVFEYLFKPDDGIARTMDETSP